MKSKKNINKVSIVMGSQSDYSTMQYCEKTLKILKIKYETNIISAHRTPERMFKFAKSAEKNNISVIIAGAGGSAHLPGMIAALTRIPVIGVPIESKKLKGLDSILSIAQMPKGIPVGTVAIGEDGAINAALLATSIIALNDDQVNKIMTACQDPGKLGIPNWALNSRKDLETGTDTHYISSDLQMNLKRTLEREMRIGSWRGVRHSLGLTVRGQRTRTSGRKGRSVGVKKSVLRAGATSKE